MRILIIKDGPREIKAQNITYNIQEIGLAIAFRKRGHICDVMSIADDNQYHKQSVQLDGQNITLYSMKAFVLLKNGWLRDADSIFDEYDILHASEYNQIFTWHLAKKYRNKMVCYHGPYYCEFNHNYNRMAKVFDAFFVNRYRKLNTCFITKSGLAKQYLEAKGLKNIHPIGVGLCTSFLLSAPQKQLPEIERIRQMDGLKLLYIGVIEPRRNSLFLLDVLKILVDSGCRIKLIMIGRYKNDSYRKQFEEKAKELSLTDYICHISRMEQKYLSEVYRLSDIFVLPTIYDIYGMVLLEAMYFGLPTITSVNGGSDMMIKDKENGIVIRQFDSAIWADEIKKLAEDKSLCAKMGEAAHQTIFNHFTWDRLADKFLEVYSTVLS